MIIERVRQNLKSAGFTMIELLIAMGILSVLAVAVLAAIDPVEQLNKSRDTGARSDSKQLVDAVERYYAVREMFPWNTDYAQAPNNFTATNIETQVVDPLVSAGELKSTFPTKISRYYVAPYNMTFDKPQDGLPSVCFEPTSKTFKEEAAANAANPGFICIP
jgi:prepilin-type N-terminal cleavage/methylation domain-containing protein